MAHADAAGLYQRAASIAALPQQRDDLRLQAARCYLLAGDFGRACYVTPREPEVRTTCGGRIDLDEIEVVATIREREQIVMAAAVVRREHELGQAGRQRDIEQAMRTIARHGLADVTGHQPGAPAPRGPDPGRGEARLP